MAKKPASTSTQPKVPSGGKGPSGGGVSKGGKKGC